MGAAQVAARFMPDRGGAMLGLWNIERHLGAYAAGVDTFEMFSQQQVCGQVQQQQHRLSEQQGQLLYQLLPLLAGTAMHAAARVPEECAKWADCWSVGILGAGCLLSAYNRHHHPDITDRQPPASFSEQSLLPLPAVEWLQQILPDGLQLAQRLLQHISPQPDSTSSATGTASTSSDADAKAMQRGVLYCCYNLRRVLIAAGIMSCEPPGNTQHLHDSDAWGCFQPHAAAVARVLDGVVRSVAQAQAAAGGQGTYTDREHLELLFAVLTVISHTVAGAAIGKGVGSSTWCAMSSAVRSVGKLVHLLGNTLDMYRMSHDVFGAAVDLLNAQTANHAAGDTAATAAAATAGGQDTGVLAAAAAGAQPAVFYLGCLCLWSAQHFQDPGTGLASRLSQDAVLSPQPPEQEDDIAAGPVLGADLVLQYIY